MTTEELKQLYIESEDPNILDELKSNIGEYELMIFMETVELIKLDDLETLK